MKITVFHEIPENVTEKPDTQESVNFGLNFMKKCQFSHEPLGLDRGFGALSRIGPTVVYSGVSGGQKCQNVQKSLGLDRDFDEND